MKLIIKLLFIFIISLTLNGCNGFKDIDKRFFVVSVGIDKEKNEEEQQHFIVSLKIVLPSSQPKKEIEQFTILSEKGRTISEAVRTLKSRVDREIEFGQMKVIVFGKAVVQEDITYIMDWFSRREDIQQVAYVSIGDPTAKAILEMQPKQEQIPSNALFLTFGNTGIESPYITTTHLFQFRRNLYEKGIDARLPIVQIEEGTYLINEASIFLDSKQKIVLPPSKTKLINLLIERYDKIDLTVQENDEYFIISVDHFTMDYQLNSQNVINIEIDIAGIIEESLTHIEMNKLEYYNQLTEKLMARRIQDLLLVLQEHQVDPFGFGLRYRATHFGSEDEKWNNWKNIYPEVSFNVLVNVELEGTGLIE